MKWQTETKKIQAKNSQTQDYLGETVWVWVIIFWLNHAGDCLSLSFTLLGWD